ncbi:MAG: hypothetical protein EVJ48_05400 [Candidatus Acidulodesulfobacterium acidiphilum]|uniref:Uncharacterized protein n=1 Tax=Candidatus Acidulodesulfobacterium acidiphilum TaxID=2597224 RepID=A0A520XDA2_9DELT|nr:MAG: hypothetical protein EVJ48_05400 [Candidatus Acidulodesulfobacterium acidiphilum]
MEVAKLFFECEKCGQPFDLAINRGDFKKIITENIESSKEYTHEFKRKFYCCGKSIEIRISIRRNNFNEYETHEVYHKGLRNFRVGDNFDSIIKEVGSN